MSLKTSLNKPLGPCVDEKRTDLGLAYVLDTRATHWRRGIMTQSVLEDPEITSDHKWDGRLSSVQRPQDS